MTVKDIVGMDSSDFNVLLNHAKPTDTLLGVTVPEITTWRYCDVIELVGDGSIMCSLRALNYFGEISEIDLMKCSAKAFVSFLKHIKSEVEKIASLEERLRGEPDSDLIAAGIEKLNMFGVTTVYYSISKDPRDWDAISELPYHKIWTRLHLDKTNKEIQKEYDKIMSNKAKKK